MMPTADLPYMSLSMIDLLEAFNFMCVSNNYSFCLSITNLPEENLLLQNYNEVSSTGKSTITSL